MRDHCFDPVYSRAAAQYLDFETRYDQQRLKQTGVYGQDQIAIGHLYLFASGRYAWINAQSAGAVFVPVGTPLANVDQKQHMFTYHLGASYVNEFGPAPYISYSTTFEPVLGSDIVTGKAFKPTSSKQWEGGVKMNARGLPRDVKLFATAALFDIKQKNFVTAQNGQANVVGSTQGGLGQVWGGEVELVARIHEQLSINPRTAIITAR